jgi:hypothetical protein
MESRRPSLQLQGLADQTEHLVMTLLHFLLVSLGLFALLQFIGIPLVRHRLRVDPTVRSV